MAAHYNGALDGYTYGSQLAPFDGVVSVQWHRTALGRFLLPGIAVERQKDGVKGAANLIAFRKILAALQAGRLVLFFPEGTSRLGSERLPIQPGTLLLLRQIRKACPAIPIYFCAADYRTPTCWGSDVAFGWEGPLPVRAESADDAAWVMDGLLKAQARAQAAPLNPRSKILRAWALLVASPFLPVWWLVERRARKTADDTNVIALWKFIYGLPATALAWLVLSLLVQATLGHGWIVTASLVSGWALWKQ